MLVASQQLLVLIVAAAAFVSFGLASLSIAPNGVGTPVSDYYYAIKTSKGYYCSLEHIDGTGNTELLISCNSKYPEYINQFTLVITDSGNPPAVTGWPMLLVSRTTGICNSGNHTVWGSGSGGAQTGQASKGSSPGGATPTMQQRTGQQREGNMQHGDGDGPATAGAQPAKGSRTDRMTDRPMAGSGRARDSELRYSQLPHGGGQRLLSHSAGGRPMAAASRASTQHVAWEALGGMHAGHSTAPTGEFSPGQEKATTGEVQAGQFPVSTTEVQAGKVAVSTGEVQAGRFVVSTGEVQAGQVAAPGVSHDKWRSRQAGAIVDEVSEGRLVSQQESNSYELNGRDAGHYHNEHHGSTMEQYSGDGGADNGPDGGDGGDLGYSLSDDIDTNAVLCRRDTNEPVAYYLYKSVDEVAGELIDFDSDWLYLREEHKYCSIEASVGSAKNVLVCKLDEPTNAVKFSFQAISYPFATLSSAYTGGPCGIKGFPNAYPHDVECASEGARLSPYRAYTFSLISQTAPMYGLTSGSVVSIFSFIPGIVGFPLQQCCVLTQPPYVMDCMLPSSPPLPRECWFVVHSVPPSPGSPLQDGDTIFLQIKYYSRYCSTSTDGTILCFDGYPTNISRHWFTLGMNKSTQIL